MPTAKIYHTCNGIAIPIEHIDCIKKYILSAEMPEIANYTIYTKSKNEIIVNTSDRHDLDQCYLNIMRAFYDYIKYKDWITIQK